ncbi:MAG: amidohydrolase family protein [Hyphomonas sp.]|nr:amidohydrolase family protein [Hyphomonas sp.]
MAITIFSNCRMFDGVNETIPDGMHVAIEGGLIREVSHQPIELSGLSDDVRRIDCHGHFLMPGLIDLHFHAYSASFDMSALDRMPKSLLASYAIKHLRDALSRGFTTVRDPGGGDVGLALAIENGLFDGPRFLYGGRALSQTGGHGDMRGHGEDEICGCTYSGVICRVVDGVDEVRRVVRNELRKGAHHIKVFISGGVASPHDPLWMPQFTNDELRAAVEEAATRRKYVIAHCHTDDGARRCVDAGVRSIDHATQILEPTATMIAEAGLYTVPTLAVVHEVIHARDRTGLSAERAAKTDGMLESMLRSIETCRRAGVKIGLGTDIFGTEFHDMQASEFRYRSEVDSPIDVLRSATSINAEIAQCGDMLGQIRPGYGADLIVLDGDPLKDLSIFERYRTSMPIIMRGGRMIRCEL